MPSTRAVLRQIEPGTDARCVGCGEPVKFRSVLKPRQVLCNVYGRDGNPDVWDRLENWHAECYEEAGQPHGVPNISKIRHGTFGTQTKPPAKHR